MSDALIRAALEARLFAVAGFPDASHRALANVVYQPAIGESWARVTHLFGNERIETIPHAGGRVFRFGLMQADLFVPLGSGESIDVLAQAVKDALPPGLPLTPGGAVLDFRIRESRRWGGKRDGAWWWDHVDVRWDCRVTNPTF